MNDSTPKVLRSTAKIPETPVLERLGYGTGKCVVSLSHVKRTLTMLSARRRWRVQLAQGRAIAVGRKNHQPPHWKGSQTIQLSLAAGGQSVVVARPSEHHWLQGVRQET